MLSQYPLSVEQEVMDAGQAVVSLVAAIKAKKPFAEELASALKLLTSAPAAATDVKEDLRGSLNAAYVLGNALYDALKGA